MDREKRIAVLAKRKERLEERLYEEKMREHEMLANRGWGYGMRHSRIGFSTRKSDSLKKKIEQVTAEIEDLIID